MRAADAVRLLKEGRYRELAELCRSKLDQEPRDVAALEFLAVALVHLGRHAEADGFLVRLIALRPESVDFRVYHGALLLHLGRLEDARTALLEARQLRPGHAACEFNLGLVLYKLRCFEDAAVALRAARQVAPARHDVCAVYESRARIRLGQYETAQSLLQSVRNPGGLEIPQVEEYAAACVSVNLFDAAETALRAALDRDAKASRLLVWLAQICERGNRVEEAEAWLDRVDRRSLQGEYLRVRLTARSGSIVDALAKLEGLQDEFATELADDRELLAELAFDRGKWLDRLGRYPEAAAAFATGNGLDRAAFVTTASKAVIEGGVPSLAGLREAPPNKFVLDQTLPLPGASPIMLVGFPRSGTTLLDQMLDAHPEAQVLEEKPLIARLRREWNSHGWDGPAAVDGLDGQQARRLRDRYWELVEHEMLRDGTTRFVDKNPFNLAWCYFVQHLFPHARWIYVIRHPLDSILSCYMNRFHYTELSHGFWSLDEIARIYRDVIGYWLSMRQRLGIQVFDLRYEALVENPEGELRALCEFVDLRWSEQLLSYPEHARKRRILTPSYDQVVRPIYRTAVHRWTHYRHELRGAIEIVRPTAEALGYRCD